MEKNSPKEAPDFISLGPGNGKKDRIILKSLKKAIQNFTNENIYYYPLDVSNKMLAQAIKTIRCEKDIEKGLLIKAVIGDFYDLPDFKELFDNRLNYNLFSFLGNTLGNVENERTLLNRIKKGMDEVDSLLLEVRLAPESEVELSIGGNKQVRNRFYYEPIARAYGIPSSKPKVFYEEHTNLSVINKTRTLVGFCRESIQGKEKLQKLTYIHHYDKKEFVSFLRDDMKFKIIESFTNDEIIYFLLKK